jgi:GT2 family glycosyltransferase
MTASIIITTKNRLDELRKAVASALGQQGEHEVIVIDDGSSDGTSAMIARDFPKVRLVTHNESGGLLVRRNEGGRLATGDILVSIDDDAVFGSPDTVNQMIALIAPPSIGVLAFPYINTLQSQFIHQRAPDETDIWLTDQFRGTAYAVKKKIFNDLGGFREFFVRQMEEEDFSLRLLAAGYFIRLGVGSPILHQEYLNRNWSIVHYYGRKNEILCVWLNYPVGRLFSGFLTKTLNGLRTAKHRKAFPESIQGLSAGYVGCLMKWKDRRPLPDRAVRLFSYLHAKGPVPMQNVTKIDW